MAPPQGHKVALVDLAEGDRVIRFGEVIGTTLAAITCRGHVNETNVRLPTAPTLGELPLAIRAALNEQPLEDYTCEGFRNPDGSGGIKNVRGITTSVQCVAGSVDYVVQRIKRELLPRFPNVDEVVGLNHSYGCGVAINAPAAVMPIRTLKNIALNPSFGNEVMVIGLGYEKLQPSILIDDRPVKIYENTKTADPDANLLNLQDESFGEMIDGILAMAERPLERLDRRRRET